MKKTFQKTSQPETAIGSDGTTVTISYWTDPNHMFRGNPISIEHRKLNDRIRFFIDPISDDEFLLKVEETTFELLKQIPNDQVDLALDDIKSALAVLEVKNIVVSERPVEFKIKRSR